MLVKPRAFIALSDDDRGVKLVNSVKYYLALQRQDIPEVVIYKALRIVVVNFLCHTTAGFRAFRNNVSAKKPFWLLCPFFQLL